MDSNIFLDNDVADSLYSGKFGGSVFASVNTLPDRIKQWVLQKYPETTHVRIGPTCGLITKMEWWIGGWINPTENDIQNDIKTVWNDKIYTQWRKI